MFKKYPLDGNNPKKAVSSIFTSETIIGSDASLDMLCHILRRLTWAYMIYKAMLSLGPSNSAAISQWISEKYPSSNPRGKNIETIKAILRKNKSRFRPPEYKGDKYSINPDIIPAMDREIEEWTKFSANERARFRAKNRANNSAGTERPQKKSNSQKTLLRVITNINIVNCPIYAKELSGDLQRHLKTHEDRPRKKPGPAHIQPPDYGITLEATKHLCLL
jgi:hypothetical protein